MECTPTVARSGVPTGPSVAPGNIPIQVWGDVYMCFFPIFFSWIVLLPKVLGLFQKYHNSIDIGIRALWLKIADLWNNSMRLRTYNQCYTLPVFWVFFYLQPQTYPPRSWIYSIIDHTFCQNSSKQFLHCHLNLFCTTSCGNLAVNSISVFLLKA